MDLPFQKVRSIRMWASGSKRFRLALGRPRNGNIRATGFESLVTTISSPSASAFSAFGQCSRTSRTVIFVIAAMLTCFTPTGRRNPRPLGYPALTFFTSAIICGMACSHVATRP